MTAPDPEALHGWRNLVDALHAEAKRLHDEYGLPGNDYSTEYVDGFEDAAAFAEQRAADLALLPRITRPNPTHCDGCGGPCRDETAAFDADAPSGPLRATESAQEPSVRGSGCTEPPPHAEAAVECRCLFCRSLRDEFPPLQETYPGSGIYE